VKTAALNPMQQMQRSTTPTARDLDQPQLPRTLSDLGRDYSRYPLSSPNSHINLKTHGVSSTGLAFGRVPGPNSSAESLTDINPFLDPVNTLDLEKRSYPDDRIGAFNPYFGGDKGFILYKDEVEDDDDVHMPMDDDDIKYKATLKDYLDNRRAIVSAIGGVFLVLGLICVFIVLPVLTYTGVTSYIGDKHDSAAVPDTGPAWAHVNDRIYPILSNVRTTLIDPDTPASAMTRPSVFDDTELQLVFSDEFNTNNRTFYPGDDPYWTAPDIWYGATQDLEWYDPDAVTTYGGTLQLRMDAFPNHNLQFRSGMLNSWNQLCFKGGVFEVSISLAGPSGVPGLWPGVWTMGNLGRPGYKATTEGVWPYTYDSCDIGITPNQSSPDGLSRLPGQKLASCTCSGEDHPNPGTGRGAPEIDVLEGSVDPNNRIGVVTQSLQVAPFDVWYNPNYDFAAIPNYNTTQMNSYCGGPYQQAISATTLLNNDWYDGDAYQKYAFEYQPGTSSGKISWFVGEDPTFILDGRSVGPNGNIQERLIPEEPMSMVLNLGISNSWSEVLLADLQFPTIMHIDYVRLYQNKSDVSVTCDPPGFPTTQYIADHPIAYKNPNMTVRPPLTIYLVLDGGIFCKPILTSGSGLE
jgi:beta-glucanase (GH16 family)